jgi:hypothetical protein
VFKDQKRLQYIKGLISKNISLLARVTVTYEPFYVLKHITLVIAGAEQLIGLVLA